VRVVGLELRNDLGLNDGAGIRVTGAGSHVELRQNRIHDIRGRNAMGITVYGTEAAAISDLVIDGNEIFDCDPAPSEALTLNGNVDGFQVTNNVVRDVNNIAIDLIGGERDIQPDQNLVARNGVVRGNKVMRARSSYGGAASPAASTWTAAAPSWWRTISSPRATSASRWARRTRGSSRAR
jgi:hypothetical protein